MGWTPGELFDVTAGLAWRLAGERVQAIGADRARLSDERTIMRRALSAANREGSDRQSWPRPAAGHSDRGEYPPLGSFPTPRLARGREAAGCRQSQSFLEPKKQG